MISCEKYGPGVTTIVNHLYLHNPKGIDMVHNSDESFYI